GDFLQDSRMDEAELGRPGCGVALDVEEFVVLVEFHRPGVCRDLGADEVFPVLHEAAATDVFLPALAPAFAAEQGGEAAGVAVAAVGAAVHAGFDALDAGAGAGVAGVRGRFRERAAATPVPAVPAGHAGQVGVLAGRGFAAGFFDGFQGLG